MSKGHRNQTERTTNDQNLDNLNNKINVIRTMTSHKNNDILIYTD